MGVALTKEQEAFLNKYEISPLSIMDCTGLLPKVYGPLLKEKGMLLAWGVTPCTKHGHRLRNSRGRCVMCDPATLAYSRRHREPGYIYVAYSPTLKLVKIGMTKDKSDRVRQLNMANLGDFNDWEIRKSVHCQSAGELETAVQRKLAKFQVDTPFASKDGYCRETYKCGLRTAINALRDVISEWERA